MADSLTSDKLRKAFLASLLLSWGLMTVITFLGLPVFLLVLAPVGVMAKYLHYFQSCTDRDLFQDQFADSFYSLGFLLTLTALVFTFFPLFYGNHTITMEETLGNFGVALLTTLLGLTVRIYLTSFSMDLEQLQKQTVMELETDVRLFKQEMGASIGVMKEFNKELEETTRKTVEDFSKSLEGAGNEITDLVQGTMRTAFEPLAKNFADLANDVKDATGNFGSNLDDSFKQCVASVDSIRLEHDLLGRAIRPALDSLEQMAGEIDASVRTISSSLEKSSTELDGSMNEFSSSVGAVNNGLTSGLNRLVDKVEGVELDPAMFSRMLEESFTTFREAVTRVAEQTDRHGQILEQNAEAARTTMPVFDKVASNMESMVEMNKELTNAMIRLAEVADRFSAVSAGLQTLSDSTRQYVKAVEGSVSLHQAKSRDLESEHQSVQQLRHDLETQYKEAKGALDTLVAAFVDIARFVPQTLKEEA
ncbi:hypothetical protein [Pseudodesulfovibrio sp. zrk46]|uniref:hypothetical protein n=1 Tax=Pseudodesulfovibrio sp. zrk46 TaxID=2725288 RepID=UPI001448B460|nr:hypothetical protein [Pseudodesulfovibrio sp. zrk46]QJB55630.1 hypothetical protein HFN16_04115 [Pseudodesulfovibrio sp. zrk46]